MTADILLTGISQLATPREIIPRAAIAITKGAIAWRGPAEEWTGSAKETRDLGGVAVTPALIDPHTHAVWAGDRLEDFEARTSGVTYEEILARGGGIRRTVRATAAADIEELVDLAIPRIDALMRSGAATIEVKSGYGFEPAAEIRMLEAIAKLAARVAARIVPTLLIHIPPTERTERDSYVSKVCEELIPEAAQRQLAKALDVFVEKGAWSAEEAGQMVRAARKQGLPFKLHTEQFHRIGGLELGAAEGATSVDHLEASTPEQIPLLANHETIATVLPGVTLHLGIPAAPGRALIDAGVKVAVGTDLNPGSSPLFSMSTALALAVRLNGLTPREALAAGTENAAKALGLTDCGRIEPGMRADLAVLRGPDWRELIYPLGRNPVVEMWIAGRPA